MLIILFNIATISDVTIETGVYLFPMGVLWYNCKNNLSFTCIIWCNVCFCNYFVYDQWFVDRTVLTSIVITTSFTTQNFQAWNNLANAYTRLNQKWVLSFEFCRLIYVCYHLRMKFINLLGIFLLYNCWKKLCSVWRSSWLNVISGGGGLPFWYL